MKTICIYVVFFFYLFSIQLNGVPLNLGTRVILSFLGLIWAVIYNRRFIKINLTIRKLSLILFLLIGISLVSNIVNNTLDLQFSLYPISILLIGLSAFFLIKLLKYCRINLDFKFLSKILIYLVFIQLLLSLLMFLSVPIRDFLNGIQVYTELDQGLLEETAEFRLTGFGSKFFNTGIVSGFALILIISLLKNEKLKNIEFCKFSLIYMFIFILGMVSARTTIIGFLLSVFIIFMPSSLVYIKPRKAVKIFLFIIILPLIILVAMIIFAPSLTSQFSTLIEFGFEMFLNYFNSGDATSTSTEAMAEMYRFPSNLQTYLIGDGYFTDPSTKLYYQGIDIGYLRLIYYFGVPGMLLYLSTHFVVIKDLTIKYPKYKQTFYVIFLYFLILNFKGFTDLLYILILFVFDEVYDAKNNKVTKIS